ncbi:hypothetical protein Tco_1081422 [Tanacetum coccineum]|uniref:Uncharacterized protein n=1 Tax=Tanacetum coccineum TaxID=301880 RepID=A0ABQ5HZ52_9ASTR
MVQSGQRSSRWAGTSSLLADLVVICIDSGPEMSFDMPISLEYMSGLGCASLAKSAPIYALPGDMIGLGVHVHPNSVITDPKPPASSYNQADVQRLSAFVVKLRNLPEEVLVLFGLIQVWKSRTCDPILKDSSGNVHYDVRPTLQRLPFYCTPPDATNAAIPAPTPKDLAAATPSSKVLAKADLYYATYPKDGVVAGSYEDPNVCKTVVDQFPTTKEMVWNESLIDDRLVGKMSFLHCLMMSYGGELLARYKGLLKSYYEYVQSTNLRLKGLQHRLTSFQGLESQAYDLKKQVTDLNDKVTNYDTAFVKAKAKGKEQKKKIKVQGELLSLAASAGFERGLSMDQTQDRLAMALKKISHFVPGAQVVTYSTQPLSVIIDLEPNRLARAVVVPAPRAASVSPSLSKELTVTPTPSSLELFSKDAPPLSTATSDQNEDWLSVMVDTADEEMVDVASDKSVEIFVQDVTHSVCEDVNRVESPLIQESRLASSSSVDVVIALSVGEKECGSPYSSGVLVNALADAGDVVAAPFGV